jgi:hypothetical protein
MAERQSPASSEYQRQAYLAQLEAVRRAQREGMIPEYLRILYQTQLPAAGMHSGSNRISG